MAGCLIVFDVDGVLCESKTPIDPEMGNLLGRLSKKDRVVFITGGTFNQVKEQVIDNIKHLKDDVLVMSLSGAELWNCYGGTWNNTIQNELTDDERGKILASIIHVFDLHKPFMKWGQIVEDRGSQITISLLGQDAPWFIKKYYDPEMEMRRAFVEELKDRLGDSFEIRMGGSTSIDISKKGLDKGTSLSNLITMLNIPKTDVVYVGDKLMEGGNDYPVKRDGFHCVAVKTVSDTKEFIKNYDTQKRVHAGAEEE